MLTIGCHLSEKEGYLAMALEAESLDANTIQFFMRNPRGGHAKKLDEQDVSSFIEYADEHHIRPLVGYASYTMNLSAKDQKERDYARMLFAEDLARMEQTPHQLYAMHCGSATGQDAERAIADLAQGINATLTPSQTTKVVLMMMSGRGSEIGSTFEQMQDILSQITLADHVAVGLDTCALWNAGYDIVNDLDGVLDAFDKTIGLDRVALVHINDSEYPKGSHEGRHAAIGQGTIGFDTLVRVIKHPKLAQLPFIIEEPHGTLAEYKKDIADFRAACTS
ncbi:deoxyribonuclease IV [Eggerthellaceae bacterium 3-80]|nr:deoxyribonuclease IV [bacterium D16-34]